MTEKTFRDSLFEGVKRFCRTEQAAHNLVDFTIDLIESDLIVAASFSDDILAKQRFILRGKAE